MSLTQIKHTAREFSLSELRKLDVWLHELIRRVEEADREEKSSPRKQIVTQQILENKTYRLESIRCGKEKCKCADGRLHGPYWYSYIRIKGRVISQYIGKRLPKDAKKRPNGSSKKGRMRS